MRDEIRQLVADITPYDALESEHMQDVLAWIDSGAPLFRIAKPDNPPKHLVSYFVLYDEKAESLLLIDHLKAKSWLPTGGHVDVNENPRAAAVREAQEELNIDAEFADISGDKPFFVTVTQTRGEGTHTDVSLWYIVKGNVQTSLAHDDSEFTMYKWLTFDQILAIDTSVTDPHMHRFIGKMRQTLAS